MNIRLLATSAIVLPLATVLIAQGTPKTMVKESPKQAYVKSSMANLRNALDHFHLDCGRYPTTAEGLAALLKKSTGTPGEWQGPYISNVPADAWAKPYYYLFTESENAILISFGADGLPGGTGENEDIAQVL